MGCVYSSRKTIPTSVFKVTNIDDSGNEKYHGQMEITACNLVLHKNGKPPIVWLLSTVRRYGYEESMFCFEAGRSSPYGQGIFAFRSKDAEHIFNAIKEKLQTDSGTVMAKDMSSEVRSYCGQSYTRTKTIEGVSADVCFNKLRYNSESNNNTQPQDPILDPDNVFLPSTSYINMPSDNEDDLLNDPSELPKDITTYTEVEISICTPERNSESLPICSTEIPSYTAIDFNRTMHLSQKMLKRSEDVGTRKTRHDSTMSNYNI